jgi:hypothetical protein
MWWHWGKMQICAVECTDITFTTSVDNSLCGAYFTAEHDRVATRVFRQISNVTKVQIEK